MISTLKFKPLLFRLSKTGGRSQGRISSYHRGGGSARHHRLVNFNHPSLLPYPFFFLRAEHDPARNLPILLVAYSSGFLAFILKTFGVTLSTTAGFFERPFFPAPGFLFPLATLPLGATAHSLPLHPRSTAQLVRSAGCSARVVKQERGRTLIKLPSGELRFLPSNGVAVYGGLDRTRSTALLKAGQSRWLGIRPTVRGVAMNPVDHPHGGGQGKTSGGRPSVDPWGAYTKGKKTRKGYKTQNFKKKSSLYIFKRRS